MLKSFLRIGHTTEAPARTSTNDDNCDASKPKSNQDVSELAAAAANAAATVKEVRGVNNESHDDYSSRSSRSKDRVDQSRPVEEIQARQEQDKGDKAHEDQHSQKRGYEDQQSRDQTHRTRQGEDDQKTPGRDQAGKDLQARRNSSEHNELLGSESQFEDGSDDDRASTELNAPASQPILQDGNPQSFRITWPGSKGGGAVDERTKRLRQKNKNRLDKAKQDAEGWKAAWAREKKEKEEEFMRLTIEIDRRDNELLQAKKAHTRLQGDHTKLRESYTKLLEESNLNKAKLESVIHEFAVHRQSRDYKEQQLQGWLAAAQTDNENLRDVITSRTVSQEPIHTEDYYKRAFNDLKSNMYDIVANLARGHPKENLTPASQTKILDMIADFGEHATCSSKYLKDCLGGLNASRSYRIPLLCHIFAIFLFDRVFSPFAFPMTKETSKYLVSIEDDLFSQGHDYNKLIMIRQAIAHGVISSCESQILVAREESTKKLSSVFEILLRHARPKAIATATAKIMNAAINLKNEMAGERGVYRIFLICCGERVLPEQINTGDEEQAGETLLMCTFPGLKRYTVEDDVKMETILIKAEGEVRPPKSFIL